MSTVEFLQAAAPWFEKCRRELAADKDSDPPGIFPDLDDFAQAGFPPLEDMLDRSPALLARLMCQFGMDLNNIFTGLASGSGVYYSTNSVDWFEADRSRVSFGGIAYEVSRTP